MKPEKTIVCDVDDTILFTTNRDYDNSVPNEPVCNKLREANEKGWKIILYTARGMGRSGGNIDLVANEVFGEIERFCWKFNIPFNEIQVGKPWARLYVDDKAIRPEEFSKIDLDNLPRVHL